MFKEVMGSIGSNLNERVASPLLGAYTIAVIAMNWKCLVVLFTSEARGINLVQEVTSVYPGVLYSLALPMLVALGFSILYPTIKALIASSTTAARILELRSEKRLEELKERLALSKHDVEHVIEQLERLYQNDKLGYHELKRILDVLPDEEHLRIRMSNKSIQATAEAAPD
jgi:hypothetical protein